MKRTMLAALALIATTAFGATTTLKQIDNIQNSTGGASIAVPSVGTTFASDTNTLTMSGKTLTSPTINAGALSGTFTGTPTYSGALLMTGGPAISGAGSLTTGMKFVDTADNTKQLIFSLSGESTASGTTLTFSGTNANFTFPAAGGTLATLGGTQTFGSTSTWNGVPITAAFGGTGLSTLTANNILIGNGTGNVTFVAPGTTGNVLTSNGTVWQSTAPASSAPTLTGSQASPSSITAAGGIALTTPTYVNYAFVVSNSGSVTVTATPSITACTLAGQYLTVVGESATNKITLQDDSGLAGSKLHLNGNWTSGLNTSLSLYCDGNGFWNEAGRY